MSSLHSTTVWFISLCALALLIGLIRHLIDRRDERKKRERIRRAAHFGERHFAGQDWTLPRHEQHDTWLTKSRSRQTHGFTLPQVAACLGLGLLAAHALAALVFIVLVVMGAEEPRW